MKIAGGNLQGSPLLKTSFQRCGDGVAERDRVPHRPPILFATKNDVSRNGLFLWPLGSSRENHFALKTGVVQSNSAGFYIFKSAFPDICYLAMDIHFLFRS